jgi:hypothetical protein
MVVRSQFFGGTDFIQMPNRKSVRIVGVGKFFLEKSFQYGILDFRF